MWALRYKYYCHIHIWVRARDHQNLGNSIEQLKLVVAKMIIIAWLELVVCRQSAPHRAAPPSAAAAAASWSSDPFFSGRFNFQQPPLSNIKEREERMSWIVFFFTIKSMLPIRVHLVVQFYKKGNFISLVVTWSSAALFFRSVQFSAAAILEY